MSIPALTICQPYAELIARGEKVVENRVWDTKHRGPLLIHAGKSTAWLKSEPELPERMDFGAIVAICELVDSVHYRLMSTTQSLIRPPRGYEWLQDDRHACGPWCWILENVRRLPEPVRCDGNQRFWTPPTHVMALVEKQLAKLRTIEAERTGK